MPNIIAIVLGGGKGTRLYPLTKQRAKPAVPFAGKYRLVDIPMSNCINSGYKQIFILTQFNSASLHYHLASTYIFDAFTKGFVEILAAEQTFGNSSWYEGTADAVRKNLPHFKSQEPTHYIILSGDQLYRMDMRKVFEQHRDSGAEITLCATPVDRAAASNLGILRIDQDQRAVEFLEKPGIDVDISGLAISGSAGERYLASMGMYIFNSRTLEAVLDNDRADFAKEIIPRAIGSHKVCAYVFNDFWVDIGTIRSFYETNLGLASPDPMFNFYDEQAPMYTLRTHLPATRLNNCTVDRSLTAEGSIINQAAITNCLIGLRTVINENAVLEGVICMGADHYESPERLRHNRDAGVPNLGIGPNTSIKHAIIDTNVRIGRDCRIGLDPIDRADGEFPGHCVKDGIVVIPKNSVIPDGSII